MPDELRLPEPNPHSIRLSCPECNGVVLALPGNSAVEALVKGIWSAITGIPGSLRTILQAKPLTRRCGDGRGLREDRDFQLEASRTLSLTPKALGLML